MSKLHYVKSSAVHDHLGQVLRKVEFPSIVGYNHDYIVAIIGSDQISHLFSNRKLLAFSIGNISHFSIAPYLIESVLSEGSRRCNYFFLRRQHQIKGLS